MTTPFPVLAEMSLPSPVRRLESFGNGNELWLKDDSHIHPIYGGNKCRKLARLLRKAAQKGARQVVTFGAAGSHHVLATSLLAQASGFSVRAFVVPQPWTAHAEQVLRASVASGAELLTLKSWVEVLQVGTQLWSSGTLLIPPGGSNISGSLGYFDAALELAVQIERGELPEPDTIVVPFGTTGTAAGLLAGLEYSGLKSKVVGVSVLRAPARAGLARAIADAILRELNERGRARRNELVIDSGWGEVTALKLMKGVERRSGPRVSTSRSTRHTQQKHLQRPGLWAKVEITTVMVAGR